MADELPIAALDACPPPRAPRESVFSCNKAEIIGTSSEMAIPVDVTDNFSSVGTTEARASDDGRRIDVNDRSRRFKLGNQEIICLIAASDNLISRSFKVLRLVNLCSSNGGMLATNLLNAASVCRRETCNRIFSHDNAWQLTQFGMPASLRTSNLVQLTNSGTRQTGFAAV